MAKRKPGKRDNEIVQGWDGYYKIALKVAFKWYSYYFPTVEDCRQAAALAATIARVAFGEEAQMGDLNPVIRKELKAQTYAYGRRQRQVKLPGQRVTTQDYKPEVSFAAVEGDDPGKVERIAERTRAIGVGEWTRVQARLLHFS